MMPSRKFHQADRFKRRKWSQHKVKHGFADLLIPFQHSTPPSLVPQPSQEAYNELYLSHSCHKALLLNRWIPPPHVIRGTKLPTPGGAPVHDENLVIYRTFKFPKGHHASFAPVLNKGTVFQKVFCCQCHAISGSLVSSNPLSVWHKLTWETESSPDGHIKAAEHYMFVSPS